MEAKAWMILAAVLAALALVFLWVVVYKYTRYDPSLTHADIAAARGIAGAASSAQRAAQVGRA